MASEIARISQTRVVEVERVSFECGPVTLKMVKTTPRSRVAPQRQASLLGRPSQGCKSLLLEHQGERTVRIRLLQRAV
eukprot:3323594-Prymnesium_polylepis.1